MQEESRESMDKCEREKYRISGKERKSEPGTNAILAYTHGAGYFQSFTSGDLAEKCTYCSGR